MQRRTLRKPGVASLFPSRIGANPQLPICVTVNRLAQGRARTLSGQRRTLAGYCQLRFQPAPLSCWHISRD